MTAHGTGCTMTFGWLNDDLGNPVELIGTWQDITKQKLAEDALKQRENSYRTLAENLPASVYRLYLREKGKMEFFNNVLEQISGYTKDELRKGEICSIDLFISPEDKPHVMEVVNNAIKNNSEFEVEYRFNRKDGRLSYFYEKGIPICGEDGKPLYIDGVIFDFTDRKQAEMKIKESEARFRLLFEISADGISIVDVETKTFIYTNPAVCRMLGYTENELKSMSITDIHPKKDLPWIIKELESLAKGEKSLTFEIPCQRKDGSIIDTEITSVITKIDGRICNVGIHRDITEKKIAENKLKRSEERLKEAQQIGRIGSWELDLAENTGTMSDEMYKIFDLHNSSIDVTIETFLTTPIPEDRKMVQELVMKSLEERKGGDFDFRTITSSGEIRWIHEKSTIELDDKGNPKRVFGTCQDITESKLAELQLKESERRTKALLNANPDMIFRMNSEGIYLDYKADSAELYAQSEVSIIGKKNRDITPPEFADLIDRYIRQTLDSGELQEFEYQMITLKRGLRDYEARMVPSGKDEVITVVRDITDRKRAEDELNISEMKFRNIVEGTKAILFSTNRRGIFTYLNEAACKILEMTNHELLGKFYLKFVHPSSRAKTHTIFTEQIENPTPNKSIDVRIITKSGKEGWLSFLINPIYMEGKIVGLSSVGLDITKRKHIEYALRESEAKLTDAMKIAKLSTWEYDCVLDRFTFPDQSFSLFNTTAEQEGGYTMSSGQFAQKYIYPDDRVMIAKELRKALETPDPAYTSYMEYRVIYAPGEIGYFSANIRIEKDVDNRTIKALGVNQDITDRKRMEETILRINKAVESSSDAICMSDSQGHHFYHNKAFTEIFEYTIEEIEAAGGGTAIYVNNDVGRKVFDIIMRWRNVERRSGDVIKERA